MQRRSLANFGYMIWFCLPNRNYGYVDYGCFCGKGGSGRPVDETDRYDIVYDIDIYYDDIFPLDQLGNNH